MEPQRLDDIIISMLRLAKDLALESDVDCSQIVAGEAKRTYHAFIKISNLSLEVAYDMELTGAVIQFQKQIFEKQKKRTREREINHLYESEGEDFPKTYFEREFIYILSTGTSERCGNLDKSIFSDFPLFGKMNSSEKIIDELTGANVSDLLISQYRLFLDKFHSVCNYLAGDTKKSPNFLQLSPPKRKKKGTI